MSCLDQDCSELRIFPSLHHSPGSGSHEPSQTELLKKKSRQSRCFVPPSVETLNSHRPESITVSRDALGHGAVAAAVFKFRDVVSAGFLSLFSPQAPSGRAGGHLRTPEARTISFQSRD